MNIFQESVCVFIDRVGMEHIKLHLSDNLPPLRQIGSENAVFMHQRDG